MGPRVPGRRLGESASIPQRTPTQPKPREDVRGSTLVERTRRDQNAVLIGIDPGAWRELSVGETHRNIALSFAALIGFQRMRAERLDAQGHPADGRRIANATVDDEAWTSVFVMSSCPRRTGRTSLPCCRDMEPMGRRLEWVSRFDTTSIRTTAPGSVRTWTWPGTCRPKAYFRCT